MLRESYILDTLECGEASFATACLLANRKYNKNNHPDEVKSHQYIISFDPRDPTESGLTMEKAQALGLQFCKDNFPGHPSIVCTHPDGHNHSGNIHVHIVIGSIRTREVERKPYMQKPRDWREGMKHSSTAQTMRHLRVEVMEMCQKAKLRQINLLEAQGDRISEQEYWARLRGQQRLDHVNARLIADGQQPKRTVYQTELETLRKQIDSVLRKATTFEEFSALLIRKKIAEQHHVSESYVSRSEKFMKGVEIMEELVPGMQEKILSGQTKIRDADLHRLAKADYIDRQKIVDEILYPERKVEPKPNTNGAPPEPGKAPYMPMQKIESVYDSDAYPKEVRYEYVALEHITTRFRTEFDYQLKMMPDNAQREVILEIIHKHKEYLASLESALAEDEQTA